MVLIPSRQYNNIIIFPRTQIYTYYGALGDLNFVKVYNIVLEFQQTRSSGADGPARYSEKERGEISNENVYAADKEKRDSGNGRVY